VKNLPRPNIIGNTEAEKIEILLNCKYIQFDEQYLRDLVRHVYKYTMLEYNPFFSIFSKSEVWYDLHAACPLVDEVFLDCYENAIFERREILHATKQRKELTLAEGKKIKKVDGIFAINPHEKKAEIIILEAQLDNKRKCIT